MFRTKHVLLSVTAAVTVTATGACAANVGTKAEAKAPNSTSSTSANESATGGAAWSADKLRLGYFANITHAAPIVGVEKGIYAKHLGSTKLEAQIFNAGPAAVEALFGGTIDAAYLGPSPAVNAFAKSKGEAVRIVAGATTGGASLVVQSGAGIKSAADLKGKTIASPQKGGTQDVALRAYLQKNGVNVGGGKDEVNILATENATTLDQFKAKTIAGGWLPEPWASRLVVEGKGTVLVDEKTLWPAGTFVTTHLLVSTQFLTKHPDVVEALLEAQVETVDWINANKDEAKTTVNAALKNLTGKPLTDEVITRAFDQITVTNDPAAASLGASKDNAVKAGLLKDVDLKGIYDLTLLNEVLKAAGKPAVDAAGLGKV
ncbi:MAG: ABC transporter substrate-binding protein [Actinomycetota bacterium]